MTEHNTRHPRVAAVAIGEPEAVAGPVEAPADETEQGYLAGLVAAARDKVERRAVIIVSRPDENAPPDPTTGQRPMRDLFAFGVRGIDGRQDEAARQKHTNWVETNGRVVPDEQNPLDFVRYQCQVIYDATVDQPFEHTVDGRKRAVAGKELWKNQRAWRAIQEATGRKVINPVDFIDAVLNEGEKDRVHRRIRALSGFHAEEVKRALNG